MKYKLQPKQVQYKLRTIRIGLVNSTCLSDYLYSQFERSLWFDLQSQLHLNDTLNHLTTSLNRVFLPPTKENL